MPYDPRDARVHAAATGAGRILRWHAARALWSWHPSLDALCMELLGSMDERMPIGIHPIHLARTFRRHVRCAPGEFARFRRLERAAALLLRTTQPLADVALASGFADQSHFSRVFVRYYGLPPGEYRALAGCRPPGAVRRFHFDKTHAAL